MLAPVLSVASRVVARSGGTPSAADVPDEDDLALLVAQHPDAPRGEREMIASGHRLRRAFFSRRRDAIAHTYTFEPGLEYEFHFIVRRLDLGTMALVGLPPPLRVRLDAFLGGQPLRLMCAHHAQPLTGTSCSLAEDDYLWDVELWTERSWAAAQAREVKCTSPAL